MGNYRFRVSDMIPNAWFYKLKDMGSKTRNPSISHSLSKRHHSNTTPFPTSPKHHHHPHLSPLSKHSSSYFSNSTKLHTSPINPKASDTHLPDPTAKSRTKRRPRRRRRTTNTTQYSVSNRCTCRTALNATDKPIVFSPSPSGISSWSSSCTCRFSSSTNDIIFDIDSKRSFSAQKLEKLHKFDDSTSSLSNQKFEVFDRFSEINSSFRHHEFENFDEFDSISEFDLPPILTKIPKFDDQILGLGKKEPEFKNFSRSSTRLGHGSLPLGEEISSLRRFSSSFAHKGLKIRANSPRLASKKIQAYCRKSNSASPVTPTKTRNKRATESFVVVKSSFDPQKDFRDSMVEMIVENNIWASKDLEELLTCYLSLNSEEHHDMIVKVFEQLWFDLTDI